MFSKAEMQSDRGFLQTIGTMLVVLFTAAVTLSALLLFTVQPMFAKMALPLLGGAQNVWNTAMVFYQLMLLGGYIYAHLLSSRFPFKTQIIVHLAVLAIGFYVLPISIANVAPPSSDAPASWLFSLLLISLGAPFFALSANAPLLQKWFSYTDHKYADDPYFLYAASNIGSLTALIAYPLLLEPFLKLSQQSVYWQYGYVLLALAIAGASLACYSRVKTTYDTKAIQPTQSLMQEKITIGRRLRWVALAFIPSSLMLGVTSHLATNVAAAPFLWVAPLAVYLLTFVIAFARNEIIRSRTIEIAFPFAVLLSLMFLLWENKSFSQAVMIHLAIFFIIAQRCHNLLAELRPSPVSLTEFYLFMSLGGVLGGAFTALLAPLIFNQIHEYPLMVAASILGTATIAPSIKEIGKSVVIGGALWIAMIAVAISGARILPEREVLILLIGIFVFASYLYFQRGRSYRFFFGFAGVALGVIFIKSIMLMGDSRTLFSERNFYGIIHVGASEHESEPIKTFKHGTTIHNLQIDTPEARRIPLAYYAAEGPFGQAIMKQRMARGPVDVAVIGLGAGAVACYAEAGESWTFYEIDPSIAHMARDSSLFSYVNDCKPDADIKVGDARLTMQRETERFFDLVIVDAFSSDSVPAHLITREALQLYRSRLNPGGLVFFHTTNRFADITSVAKTIAQDAGLASRAMHFSAHKEMPFHSFKYPTSAVLIGNEKEILAAVGDDRRWVAAEPNKLVGTWTDDYSNILGAIAAHKERKAKIGLSEAD